MFHSTPGWRQRPPVSARPVPNMQQRHWWRPLLWAGLLAIALLLAWQASTSGALQAADSSAPNAITLNSEWRFVDESKPGAPFTAGLLTVATADAPAPVAARFDISSTMQALALQLTDGDLGGVPLAEVEEMRYCTRLVDGPRPYAVTLQINVDADVTDGDNRWQGRLVYTPSYNGAVIQGEWQCWDTLVGKWWATGGPVVEFATVDNPLPLGTLLAHFPHLGINATYSGVALKAGDGWRDFLGEASPVVIGVEGERIDVAFGNAPPASDTPQENEVLLPVVFNEPQGDNNGNQDQPDQAKKDPGRGPKWDGVDWANFNWESFDWEQVDWEHIDWEHIDWEHIDWEHIDWTVWGWPGMRAENVRGFIDDVKGCKKDGWEEKGFKNQGQCVAYYAAAHSPASFSWGYSWDRNNENRADTTWNDANRGDRNGRGRHDNDD